MCIILVELPYSGEACESSRFFVSVKHPEIGISDGEVSVAFESVFEHEAVRGTVHGFDAELFFLVMAEKHVINILEVMTTGLPQLVFEHRGSDHFSEPSEEVLVSHQIYQSIEDSCSVGEEEGTSRGIGVEVEQVLGNADLSMVFLLQFLQIGLILFQFFLRRKGESVDSLQRVEALLPEPIRRRVHMNGHGFDFASIIDMRASAQVH